MVGYNHECPVWSEAYEYILDCNEYSCLLSLSILDMLVLLFCLLQTDSKDGSCCIEVESADSAVRIVFLSTHYITCMHTHKQVYVQHTCMYIYAHVTHVHILSHSLHSEAVPPDVYRKKPMCMSQYNMYSKCRIPYPGVDRVRHTPISESKHIVIIRNGHVRHILL